jgi:hypothetical protein
MAMLRRSCFFMSELNPLHSIHNRFEVYPNRRSLAVCLKVWLFRTQPTAPSSYPEWLTLGSTTRNPRFGHSIYEQTPDGPMAIQSLPLISPFRCSASFDRNLAPYSQTTCTSSAAPKIFTRAGSRISIKSASGSSTLRHGNRSPEPCSERASRRPASCNRGYSARIS